MALLWSILTSKTILVVEPHCAAHATLTTSATRQHNTTDCVPRAVCFTPVSNPFRNRKLVTPNPLPPTPLPSGNCQFPVFMGLLLFFVLDST